MKSRPWILILALLITLSAVTFYYGWSLFKANEKIKNFLITQLRPVLGTKSEVERLDIALGAIHLKNVKIIPANQRYELSIRDLRIGYNLVSLIKSGFKPEKSAQDILFVQPQLTIYHLPKDTTIQPSETTQNYWEKIHNIDFLKRITVSKGSMIYVDSLNQSMTLANDISGWVSMKDVPYASLRLVGKLFNSKQLNLKLNGDFNLIKSKLDSLQINLMNFEWKEKIPFLIPHYIDIQQGTISGDLVLKEKSASRTFDIWGKISVENGAFSIQNQNLYISDIQLQADLNDWDLTIRKSKQSFNGSPVYIEGSIKNILNPELNLKLSSDSFDIQKFQGYFNPQSKIKFRGLSSLSIHVQKSHENPLIEGNLRCPKLSINDIRLNDVNLKLSFFESVLNIQNFSGQHKLLTLTSDGWFDFTKPDSLMNIRLSADGFLPADFTIQNVKSLAQSQCRLNVNLLGNLRRFSGESTVSLVPQFNDSTTFTYAAQFLYNDDLLTLTLTPGQGKAKLDGSAVFGKKGPRYKMNLKNFHEVLYTLPEFQRWGTAFNFDVSEIQLNSEPQKLYVKASYRWKNGRDNPVRSGELAIQAIGPSEKKKINYNLTARFGSQSYHGDGSILLTPESMEITDAGIDDAFISNAVIELTGEKKIAGQIVFSNTPLGGLYNILFPNSSVINRGTLIGTIELGGTTLNPMVNGQLMVNDTYLHQVGRFHGNITFNLQDQLFNLEQFQLNKNDSLLFKIFGTCKLDQREIDFKFLGDHINLNPFIQSLADKPDLIKGYADTDLHLAGTWDNPRLSGDLHIGKGKFTGFHFDSVYVDFGDDDISGEVPGRGIGVQKFLLDRKNEFQIQGKGIIPIFTDDEMKIAFEGNGNLFSILPEITDFFKETAGSGKWQFMLSGRPNNISIESGSIRLSDGYLKLKDVAPEIKNISVSLDIESDGFVKVDHISGQIKGKPFKLSNERWDMVECRQKLEPLTVPTLGLDFGVFSVETSPKGVPLHIPGLMDKGEIGNFEFIGREDNEKFYTAGPASSPVMRGIINLRNVNVMYPFATTPGMEHSLVTDILMSANWNILAIPVKDTNYEKEIPSGVDKLYANLMIDSGVGGLDFSGVIEDSSFRVEGKLECTEGIVEYLDFDFRIEKAGIEFDRSTLIPMVYGQAKAAIADSMGNPNYIYLTLLLNDEPSGFRQTKGRWGNIQFQMTTDNPNIGLNEAEILASMGYSGDNIRAKATDIIGISTDNLLFRPLLRPFERQLERTFNLDMVRVSSRFARNLIEMNLWREKENLTNPYSKLYLLRSTRLMIGKSLADRLFLSYTGELESGLNYHIHGEELGLKHTLGLEFRINPSLLLEMEYNYNSFLLDREDKRIFLRHTFQIQREKIHFFLYNDVIFLYFYESCRSHYDVFKKNTDYCVHPDNFHYGDFPGSPKKGHQDIRSLH